MVGKGLPTEQFTARIDSRIYQHIERLAASQRKSKNEALNYLLKLGLIALSEKRKRGIDPSPPDSHGNASTTIRGESQC